MEWIPSIVQSIVHTYTKVMFGNSTLNAFYLFLGIKNITCLVSISGPGNALQKFYFLDHKLKSTKIRILLLHFVSNVAKFIDPLIDFCIRIQRLFLCFFFFLFIFALFLLSHNPSHTYDNSILPISILHTKNNQIQLSLVAFTSPTSQNMALINTKYCLQP